MISEKIKVCAQREKSLANYGFDIITQISEYNAGLCRIEKA
jgi:formate dehydrogenase major subunit